MAVTSILPTIKDTQGLLGINTGALNYILEEEIYDNYDEMQSQLGCYSWMQLRNRREHKVTVIETPGFLWQPDMACTWDPMGEIKDRSFTVPVCGAKINMEWCDDAFVKSCYEYVLEYSRNSEDRYNLNAEGQELLNKVVRSVGRGATLGARGMLVTGHMYDFDKLEAELGYDPFVLMTNKKKKALKTQVGTCRGWIALMQQKSKEDKYKHYNLGAFSADGLFNEHGDFVGDVLDFFQKQLDASPRELKNLNYRGGLRTSEGTRRLLWKVDSRLYDAIVKAWQAECAADCNTPRFFRTQFTEGGEFVYKVDNFYVVPIDDTCRVDDYLKGHTAISVLTIAGNICLGGSFDDVPNLGIGSGGQPIGLAIQASDDIRELGKIFMAAWGLFSSAIADKRYISGNFSFIPHKQ